MKVITTAQAKQMKDSGVIFKPHHLYQSEKTAVLVQIGTKERRAFQITKPSTTGEQNEIPRL